MLFFIAALKRNEDKVKKIVQGYAKEGDMNNAKVQNDSRPVLKIKNTLNIFIIIV